MSQAHDADKTPQRMHWNKAPELPPAAFAVWHKPHGAISPVAIVATVDADGAPRAAPFGSLRAMTPCLLRFSPTHFQTTYANVRRDGRVTVVMIAPPNIAVSVRGRARVVRERMLTNEHRAVIDIDVEEVKNDMVSTLVIDSGVTISPQEEFRESFKTAFAEIEEIP